MKKFYLWYCIVVVVIATMGNYWVVSPARGWSSGSGGFGYTGSSGWHK